MPAPTNAAFLTLGPPIVDSSMFRPDTDPAVIAALMRMESLCRALGGVAPAQDTTDEEYGLVVQKVADELFYRTVPEDPMNPVLIGSAAALSFQTIAVAGQDDVVADSSADTLTLVAGTNITLTTDAATDTITIDAAGGGGGASNSFVNIAVSGQTDIVADSTTDTLTVVAGTGITITTNAGADTLTITNSGATAAFSTIAISGQSDVVADSASDTLTLVAGAGIVLTTVAGTDTITIASTGVVTAAFTTIAVSGQSDVVADSTADTLTLGAGTGIEITTNAGTDTVTVTAPFTIAKGFVDISGGVAWDDATFPISAMSSLIGPASGATGTADNTETELQLAHGQQLFFFRAGSSGNWYPLAYRDTGTVKVTIAITARSGADPYTWGSGGGTILKKTDTATAQSSGGTDITVYNTTLHTAAVDDIIQVKRIDGEYFWDVADCTE